MNENLAERQRASILVGYLNGSEEATYRIFHLLSVEYQHSGVY